MFEKNKVLTFPTALREYTIVLLKDNKTIANGDFVAQMDITVTSDTYETKALSSDPIIHMNFDGKAEDSCGNATLQLLNQSQ